MTPIEVAEYTKGQLMILIYQGQFARAIHHKDVRQFKSLREAWKYKNEMN